MVRTKVEGKRGCGWRRGGGLYLISDEIGIPCGLLPVELSVCPTCHAGIKPTRGWQWVEPDPLLPHHLPPSFSPSDDGDVDELTLPPSAMVQHPGCPLNELGLLGERCGLLWIGESFYPLPESWIREGRRMGFSRRIAALPKDFKAGETWVLAAHRKAITRWPEDATEPEFAAGVFHIWRPDRVEYVVKGDESEEELERLVKRGIEPVRVVPGDDTELAQLDVEEGALSW